MLVSYRWLQDYLNLDGVTAAEIAERLTRGGIEVDIIHTLNKGIKDVVVGHVVEKHQHPNADKLNVCQVDLGEADNVQIVCGAANVAAGQKVAVAKVGAVLPGNFKIKKAKLRGEASNGMICSLQELGIEGKLVQKEFAEGIFVFPNDIQAGSDALEALNLNDEVLELDLTPNRADCLNMIGVAYEVGALLERDIKLPEIQYPVASESASNYINVKVEASEDNPYYGAIIIKDIKIGPSPLWLQNRLMAAGIRPISNVVDITNYVLLEYGQPLHAFDYDRFGSKEVVVRRAKDGEKIVTLDDTERTLTSDHLVITNGKEPVAIAGVMGGANSEVHSDTTTILIEAAYFEGVTVRKASRDLGLRSEASLRYEKGLDRSRVKAAAQRAAALIVELAGGTVLEGIVEYNLMTQDEAKVTITVERINQLLGMEIEVDAVAKIFDRLRFKYDITGTSFTVSIPSRRRDITIEEDLVEEVARLYGYDHIPTTLPIGLTTPGALTPYQAKRRKVRRYVEKAGLSQTITYSLTSPSKAEGIAGEHQGVPAIRLAMPMSEDRSTLRTSLLPHLLDIAKYNMNRKIQDVAVYELGSIFMTDEQTVTKQPTEREMLAGVLTGQWFVHQWQGEKKKVDFFVAKGIVEGIFAELGLQEAVTYKQGKQAGLHPGRTALVYLEDKEIGFVGQVHPKTEKELDLNETYVFQLDVEAVLSYESNDVFYKALPRFPAITRDIALVVDEEISSKQVEETITHAGGELLKSVYVFDLYQGEHMEKGKKSLAFSLTYVDPEKTLTDEEVSAVHEKVLSQLEKEAGATLRG